jgi:ergothioneine biosynthesis glutamate--cysteine ligase EgtA
MPWGNELKLDDAEAHVRGVCFKNGPPGLTGVELEWLVHDSGDPLRTVPKARIDEALAPLAAPDALPYGSSITREPGGQVELSSLPAATLVDSVHGTATDLAVLRRTLATDGLALSGCGLDPYRDPPRVLDHPRYRAMEAYFDRIGPWGRVMMRGTAAVQVNLDNGDGSDGVTGYRYRWELAHRLGPVLVAAFANSPLWQGAPTGWRSARRAVWDRLDPRRTAPPDHDDDPRTAWARYALDQELLCVRRNPPEDWSAPPELTFRSWLDGGHRGLRPPTLADLDYHLSTLFPPVRPRGWLELRMLDALPGDDWMVATVVTATLMDDPTAARAAWDVTEPLCTARSPLPSAEVWEQAGRCGPSDPLIGRAVNECFAVVRAALDRTDAPAALRDAVADFSQRYPERGRCPADDRLDALRLGAAPYPLDQTW